MTARQPSLKNTMGRTTFMRNTAAHTMSREPSRSHGLTMQVVANRDFAYRAEEASL